MDGIMIPMDVLFLLFKFLAEDLGYILTAWKQEGSFPLTPALPDGLSCLKLWKPWLEKHSLLSPHHG